MRQRLQHLVLGIVILAVPVMAQQPSSTPPPRTVTAPVTVVAPATEAPETLSDKDAPVRVVQEGPVRVVQSGPVTFTLPLSIWIAWLVSIAAGLGALAAIWRFVIKASTIITNLSKYGSVLIEIAGEFKSNSGSTLKDSIDRIENACALAQTSATLAKDMADNLEKMLRDHMALAEAREEVRVEQDRRDDQRN